MNKYLRLSKMGSEGFTQREWSVINLNLAICYQFQNRLAEGLEKVEEAIQIDPKYEKPYYRKIQLLSEMGNYEYALHPNVIPLAIRNK